MATNFRDDNGRLKDFYKVLKIANTAKEDEIKKAYRSLALTTHPDKKPSDQAEQQDNTAFQEISEAYQVLSNPTQRALYDNEVELEKKGFINQFGFSSTGESSTSKFVPQYYPENPTDFYHQAVYLCWNYEIAKTINHFEFLMRYPDTQSKQYENELPVTFKERMAQLMRQGSEEVALMKKYNSYQYQKQPDNIELFPEWKENEENAIRISALLLMKREPTKFTSYEDAQKEIRKRYLPSRSQQLLSNLKLNILSKHGNTSGKRRGNH